MAIIESPRVECIGLVSLILIPIEYQWESITATQGVSECARIRYRGAQYVLALYTVLAKRWVEYYNKVRPHGSLGGRPPAPEVVIPPPLPTKRTTDMVGTMLQ